MPEPLTRLYLVTPRVSAAADLPGLDATLAAGDVACLLLRLQPMADRPAKDLIKALARSIQGSEVALLLEDARLATHTGADGVHVESVGDRLTEALGALKPERIVGVGGLETRDAAMQGGEAGADYVMFGEPVRGAQASELDTIDRVRWWAEIFNVPCVGFANTLGEVETLAEAGADFVALADAVWGDPRGPAKAVADAQAALRRAAVTRAERELT